MLFVAVLQREVASTMKKVCNVGLDGSAWGVRREWRGKRGLTPSPRGERLCPSCVHLRGRACLLTAYCLVSGKWSRASEDSRQL